MAIGSSSDDEKQLIRSLPPPANRMVFLISPHQTLHPQISPGHKALNSESTSFLIVSPISSKGQVVDSQKSVSSSVRTGQQENPENISLTGTCYATSIPPVSPSANTANQLPENSIFTSDGAPVPFVSSFVNTSELMAPRDIKVTPHITPGSPSMDRSHKTVHNIMTTSCATSVSPSARHHDSNKSPLPETQNISSNDIQASASLPIFFDTSIETPNENHQKSSCNTKVSSQTSSLPVTLSSTGEKTFQEKFLTSVQLLSPETGSIKQFNCSVCGKMFGTKKRLNTHLKCHSEERPHKCSVCNKTFKTPSTLSNHKRIHYEKKKHKCSICNYSSFDACSIVEHKKRHFKQYKFKCDTCGKGLYTKRELENHNNLHIGHRPFVCSDCGKSYTTPSNLKDHRKGQHEKKTLECDKCNKLFAFKSSLLRHIQSHTEESRFLCEVCGKALGSREALRRHHPVHSDEKPYMCATCGKAFRSRNYLLTHQRIHTGEKPYKCERCSKAFTQHSTLVIHRRYHTGDRPYKCHLCSKGYVSKSELKSHIANHDIP